MNRNGSHSIQNYLRYYKTFIRNIILEIILVDQELWGFPPLALRPFVVGGKLSEARYSRAVETTVCNGTRNIVMCYQFLKNPFVSGLSDIVVAHQAATKKNRCIDCKHWV